MNSDAEPISRKIYEPRPAIPRFENVAPIDYIVRRLCRFCWIVKKPEATGKFIQLAIQIGDSKIGKLPENMYLNQVPHNRYVRKHFYEEAANATLEACLLCSQGKISNRMELVTLFPETNTAMDSYR